MNDVVFSVYGFSTDTPPVLRASWNEQKRLINLNGHCHVFKTNKFNRNWMLSQRFPNANKSTLFYYWTRYAEKRIKESLHWIENYQNDKGFNLRGSCKSKIFNER